MDSLPIELVAFIVILSPDAETFLSCLLTCKRIHRCLTKREYERRKLEYEQEITIRRLAKLTDGKTLKETIQIYSEPYYIGDFDSMIFKTCPTFDLYPGEWIVNLHRESTYSGMYQYGYVNLHVSTNPLSSVSKTHGGCIIGIASKPQFDKEILRGYEAEKKGWLGYVEAKGDTSDEFDDYDTWIKGDGVYDCYIFKRNKNWITSFASDFFHYDIYTFTSGGKVTAFFMVATFSEPFDIKNISEY